LAIFGIGKFNYVFMSVPSSYALKKQKKPCEMGKILKI